jgi:peptidoglycan/LPS O-acetylase OafA/YrhL
LGFFFILTGSLLTLLYDQRLKDGKSAADFAIRRIGRTVIVLGAVAYRFIEALSRELFELGTRIRRGEIGWPKAMQQSTQESG